MKKNILEQASTLKENDYYTTPPEFFNALLGFLGIDQFALDPCSPSVSEGLDASLVVPAHVRYTEEQNGLLQSWNVYENSAATPCHVFLNPPYSNYEPWIAKAVEETQAHENVYVWALLNSSNSQFWQDIITPLMKFRINTRSRVSFYLKGVQGKNNRYDNVLIHFAKRDNYLQYIENNPKQFPIRGMLFKPGISVGG